MLTFVKMQLSAAAEGVMDAITIRTALPSGWPEVE